MEPDNSAVLHEIIQFPKANGAIFMADSLASNSDYAEAATSSRLILIPVDDAFRRLLTKAQQSVEFLKSPFVQNIILDHLRAVDYEADKLAPRIVSKTQIQNTTVLIIDTIIVTRKDIIALKEHLALKDEELATISYWSALPYDVFVYLIEVGELRGKDLISLCISNSVLNQRCNYQDQNLFRRLLKRDYNLEAGSNPRAEYIKASKWRVYSMGPGASQVSAGFTGHGSFYGRIEKPTQIPGLIDVVSVSCGFGHAACTDAEGFLYTWGSNNLGQLARTGDATKPHQVTSLSDVLIRKVSCGRVHTVMLDYDGHVWSCGYNEWGQLGSGHSKTLRVPTMVNELQNIVDVSCGSNFTLCLDKNGRIWVSGRNDQGLGIIFLTQSFHPRLISQRIRAKSISAGAFHAAFIDEGGILWTFGSGEQGQLGFGLFENQDAPREITALSEISMVSCGGYHTVCLNKNGQLITFGYGKRGGLCRPLPENVDQTAVPEIVQGFRSIKYISCGEHMTTFIDAHGQLWYSGVSIDGSGIHDIIPRQIIGATNVGQVACDAQTIIFLK